MKPSSKTKKSQIKGGRKAALSRPAPAVTRLAQTELALRESEERYRRIVQTAEEGVWTINAASLTDYVNPKMAQMMGYKAEEMIGRPIDDFLDDEGRAMLARLIKRRKGGIAEQFEFKYLRKDGSELWAFVSTNPITDANGVYVGAMALLTDISARREAETAMRESEARYRLLADHCDDIVGLNDTKGNRLYISPSYYRKTGWTPEDLQSSDWRSRIHPDDIETVERARLQNLAGKATRIEHRTSCKDGSWIWCETNCKPLTGPDGKVWRLLVWSHDITDRKQTEIELAHVANLLLRTGEIAKIGGWELDLKTSKLVWSLETCRLFEVDVPEAPSLEGAINYYAPEARPIIRAAVNSAIEKGTPYDLELRVISAKGRPFWARSQGAPVFEGHQIIKLIGTFQDISDKKEADIALRESEEKFRAIFDQAAVGVAIRDSFTGKFLNINDRYCEIIGLPRKKILERSFMDFVHPDDLQIDLEQMQNLRDGKISHFTMEKRYLRAKGPVVWVSLTVSPLWKPGEAPSHHIAVVEHITDRKLAEAKYLRELKFNETLVDHTSVIIVLLDRQGRMEHVNQATVDILGYSRKELLGRTPWAVGIMDPEEKLRAMERLQVLLKGGGSNPPRETILKAKDGKPHVFSLSSVATNAPDGTVDRIIVTGTDLTERNRMQREILKISEQEQARIGHNLHDGVGQTMTGVATLIEALESELEGRQRDSAERIRQLIQQAIQEVRRMSHSMSPAAVKNRGLGGVLQLLAETIRINHRTQCVCEVDSSVHIRDSEMETHIYRIAQEAANNAIRHGKPAKISISLKRHSDRECVLTIEDDGSGISKASRKAGHGIGMQVMDYRANLIGGSLKIAAKPRRGVRVTCRFPCDSSQARKP